jgi:hypothetical protein
MAIPGIVSVGGLTTNLFGQYASDSAAAAGGILDGNCYINSATGAVTMRRT